MSTVLVLSSRPLSPSSVLGAALGLLREQRFAVGTAVVSRATPLPAPARSADLLVLRDVPLATLTALDGERRQVPTCNSTAASAAASDKVAVDRTLRSAGVPVPGSAVLSSWRQVVEAAAGSAVAVKPNRGRDGAGVLLCPDGGSLPHAAPYPGPYLVQELVPGDGVDRKLYVVDGDVFGVLRRWPPRTEVEKRGTPFEPSGDERSVARAAGEALGLEVFGVDVVGPPTAPVVVDVNPMPGFKGVDGAAHRLARHFRSHVTQEAAPCAS